jgi:hypothetical protein
MRYFFTLHLNKSRGAMGSVWTFPAVVRETDARGRKEGGVDEEGTVFKN